MSIYSSDDATSSHRFAADEACELEGTGVDAYLSINTILDAASSVGANAIHPGYGFLSENAEFAAACEASSIIFVGPSSQCISLFGNKTEARQLAQQIGVPINKGSLNALPSPEAAKKFIEENKMEFPVMLKAVHGGGGRGIRVVGHMSDIASNFKRCVSEAQLAFGSGGVFVEEYIQVAPLDFATFASYESSSLLYIGSEAH